MSHIRVLATLTYPDTEQGRADAEAMAAYVRDRAGKLAEVTHARTGRPDPSRVRVLRSYMDEAQEPGEAREPERLDTFEKGASPTGKA